MRRAIIPVAAAFLCVLLSVPAFPLGGDYRDRQAVGTNPQWPAGLDELVKDASWVGGYFVNADDFHAYAGDTEAFNGFVRRYAELKDTPLVVVLDPGPGVVSAPWPDAPKRECDWSLSIVNRAWRAPRATTTQPAETGYAASVHLHLGPNVRMDALDIPLNVEVRSGKRIENFVARHQARRAAATAPATQPSE